MMFTGGLIGFSPSGETSMSKYLFDNIPQLIRTIKNAESITLFLDYDGTLVRFKTNPMDAIPEKKIITLIKRLIKNPKTIPVIVTGRRLRDIKFFLPIKNLDFIYLHGFGMTFPDFHNGVSDSEKHIIRRIFEEAKKEFSNQNGVFVSNKDNIAVALHYRGFGGNPEGLRRVFKEIVKKHDKNGRIRIMDGSMCLQAILKEWDKGKAVSFVLNKYFKGAFPVYFGDDITDEDVFKVLRSRGITVYVKNDDTRKTNAEFYVNDPEDVFNFLSLLNNEIQ